MFTAIFWFIICGKKIILVYIGLTWRLNTASPVVMHLQTVRVHHHRRWRIFDVICTRSYATWIYPSHKSHNALDKYPMMHNFVETIYVFYGNNWPNSQIPQCTCPASHDAPFCNRNVHMLQNGALWDMELVHCEICATGVFFRISNISNTVNFNKAQVFTPKLVNDVPVSYKRYCHSMASLFALPR